MAYRKRTLRTMSPVTRKLARLAGEAGSLERRLKALVDEVQNLEHENHSHRNHSFIPVPSPAIGKPLTDDGFEDGELDCERDFVSRPEEIPEREESYLNQKADFDEVTQ